MKLDIRAFTASFTILTAFFSLILFIWCASNGFGVQVVQLFESVHPSGGFSIVENLDAGFFSKIPGVIINTVYAALDAFIVSFLFSTIYNLFAATSKKRK